MPMRETETAIEQMPIEARASSMSHTQISIFSKAHTTSATTLSQSSGDPSTGRIAAE